ncbi:unnamed protein product [Soboliphyme baturini]|uniref:Uncharacterized protein n=1 Tax=Soboliphyme baturini TaxID=241478 RepID=A0A183IAR4_9BILA|nr:unnamed protein product [Soboliphyme baturini]
MVRQNTLFAGWKVDSNTSMSFSQESALDFVTAFASALRALTSGSLEYAALKELPLGFHVGGHRWDLFKLSCGVVCKFCSCAHRR